MEHGKSETEWNCDHKRKYGDVFKVGGRQTKLRVSTSSSFDQSGEPYVRCSFNRFVFMAPSDEQFKLKGPDAAFDLVSSGVRRDMNSSNTLSET